MKNNYILFLLLMSSIFSSAQVGVNTSNPQSDLHVNGSFQVTKELRVASDNLLKGNAGSKGQVLISKGANEHPFWEDLEEVLVLPIINAIAQYNGNSNLTTNTESTLKFNSFPFLDTNNINYNISTGEFTF